MHTLTLRDGRTLAYSWFGMPRLPPPAAGPPGTVSPPVTAAPPGPPAAHPGPGPGPPRVLLHFHGFLSSRLEGDLLHEHALHHGLSVLAVDRPGAGGSMLNPQQSVESTAEDVRELLDSLQLHSVAVQGASGGAPFACAAASMLGERVESLLLVCPLMPVAGREGQLLPGTSPSTLRLFHGARHHPWRMWATLHALRLLQRIPHGSLLVRLSGFAQQDRRVMEEQPAVAAVLQAAVREGLAQGVAGALQDLQMFYARPSSLDLASIRCPTHIWQGGADTTTPAAMAHAYAEALPQAELLLLQEEGHLSLPFKHNRAILGSIARNA